MQDLFSPVGIDAMAVSLPEGYLDLSDLAEARGIPREKYLSGLLVKEMAVARPEEDPVALAANASRRLFRLSGVDPLTIGLCVVGTETAVDHAKPIAAYLHSLLGLPKACRLFETKHACFGGTAGLFQALDWIRSGSAGDKQALVICTDIARYPLRTAGEPTQGAGAVAMLVSKSPRLVEIHPGLSGGYSRDVYDFWRPLGKKDALTDGHFSVQCYLEALGFSFQEFRTKNKGYPALAKACYHVPYGKMAKKAHLHRKMMEGASEKEAEESFSIEVGSSLDFPSRVGNVYTGSLYLALASLLHHEGSDLFGQHVGMFSYGSGCVAEFFAARVSKWAPEMIARLRLEEPLLHRRRLTVQEYEQIRLGDDAADSLVAPEGRLPFGGQEQDVPSLEDSVVFVGVDKAERRVYQNRSTSRMTRPSAIR